MKRDGLENVSTQPVKVPHWVRGREDAEMVKPVRRSLTMLGLGGSVATPAAGITAEVVPVSSFDALERPRPREGRRQDRAVQRAL